MPKLYLFVVLSLMLAVPAWGQGEEDAGEDEPEGESESESEDEPEGESESEDESEDEPEGESESEDEVEHEIELDVDHTFDLENEPETEPEAEPETETETEVDPLAELTAEEIAALRAILAGTPTPKKARKWHGPAPTPSPARTTLSDFVNTTLTFYVGDDNLLAGDEDGSPNLGFSNEYPELFFEGLNSEKQAVVSESHLVLYGRMPGYIPYVDTEAAFVAEFELSRDPDDNQLIGRFRDDGSYIGLTFWFDRSKRGKNLKLTAWPYSADRFRLGYTYDLTWGGNTIWARNRGPVPGAKLNLDLERFYVFVGAKALVRLRADNNETENYWGILGGLGPNFEFGPALKFNYDLSGGYFARGTFQQDPFRSVPLQAFGLSQRVQLTHRTRMGLSPDLKGLRNRADEFYVARSYVPNYEGQWGFGVGAEFTTLWQTLIDADDPSEQAFDNAITVGGFAQVRFAKSMRIGIDMVYRNVSFLVFNVPGLTPYVSFAEDTIRKPQVYGALWWDWYISRAHITPGVIVGLMQPASFAAAPDAQGVRQLQVIREANDYELMPADTETAFTILSGKASLTWHLSSILAIVGEVSFTQDFNNSKVVTNDETGVGERVLDEKQAQQLGLNLLIQASF